MPEYRKKKIVNDGINYHSYDVMFQDIGTCAAKNVEKIYLNNDRVPIVGKSLIERLVELKARGSVKRVEVLRTYYDEGDIKDIF